MDLFSKKDLTKEEYIYARCLSIFGMKKIIPEKYKKLTEHEENKYVPSSLILT
jgi:hypothetical protein